MAKHKNKRKLSDRVCTSKVGGKPDNLFEFHFNRSKRNIIGHTTRCEKGRPGISKAKSVQMRRRALLNEMKTQHRANEFVDRRLGGSQYELSAAERMTHRFTAERKRQSKKDMFNLGDTTELTHMGVTIDQLDKYEDPRSDDEEDAALSSDFVKQTHFGGGLFSKAGPGQPSGKDWVENMITESLRRKNEAYKLREQTLALTEQLDSEYRDLAPLVKKSSTCHGVGATSGSDVSRQAVSAVTDSLLNGSVIGSADMVRSNNAADVTCSGPSSQTRAQILTLSSAGTGKSVSLSADTGKSVSLSADTGTSVSLSADTGTSVTLSADAGKSVALSADTGKSVALSADAGKSVSLSADTGKSVSLSADTGKSVSVIGSSDVENDYDRLVKQLSFSRRIRSSAGVNSVEQSKREERERVRQLEEDRKKRMCDEEIANDDSISQHISADLLKSKALKKESKAELSLVNDQLVVGNTDCEQGSAGTSDCVDREPELRRVNDEEVAAALKWSSFSATVSCLSPLQQLHFLQRLATVLDPSRGPQQRARLCRLYRHVLRHMFCVSGRQVSLTVGTVDLLLPLLYDMTQRLGGAASGAVWRRLLQRRYSAWVERQRPGLRCVFPTVSTLLMLRSAVLLYPPSDHRHPVTLPAILFMMHVLNKCVVTNHAQLARALFVVSLLVECTSLSRRLVPEAVACLQSLIFTACAPSAVTTPELMRLVTLPYSSSGPSSHLLRLEKSCAQLCVDQWKLSLSDLASTGDTASDLFRLRATHVLFSLLSRLLQQYSQLPAAAELFQPSARLAVGLPVQLYPESLRSMVAAFISAVERLSGAQRFTLARADRKPKPLPLYEPQFNDSTEGRGVDLSRGGRAGEHQRLLRCHRRELRSTVRHVRRDAAILSRHTLDRRIRADKERKGKVKHLMAMLGNQEGDFRKLERQKKKK